jgi:hypothetical protein
MGVSEFPLDLTFEQIIQNQTVNLSPFIAALWRPTPRWFAQGFLQFDLPLNRSRGEISLDAFEVVINDSGDEVYERLGDFRAIDKLKQQTLMRFNIGTGYWFYKDETGNWLTGLAGMIELHYTTTLNKATVSSHPNVIDAEDIDEDAPTVNLLTGNLANRVDSLNLALGVPMEFGQVLINHGFVVPLRSDFDKGFDFEYSCQLQYRY